MSTIEKLQSQHLVIVRTGASIINLKSYNCQELGLAKSLTKRGLKVSIILAGKKYEEKEIYYEGSVIRIYFVKFISLNQAISYFFNLDSILTRLKPTIIQIHEFGMAMSFRTLLWAKKRNIKIVLIQGSYQTTQKPIFKQIETIYNWTFGKYLLDRVNNIGYKSLMAAKYIHKYSTASLQAAYIGLDIDKFSHTTDINWNNKLNLNGKKIILYIGLLEQRRNPLFLARILEKLPSEYVLLVAGDGILKKELEKYISEHNLSERIKLLGKLKQEELPSLYKLANLFLLASNYEIYGMVLLESMYFGTPVISTMTAGSEILIENNKDGIIMYDGLNEDSWAKKIQEIVETPELLKKMSNNASTKIVNNFIWDKACDNFIKIYSC